MPLYDYQCPRCDRVYEHFHGMDESRQFFCLDDEYPLRKLISAARVLGDYPGYECPVTGKWVEGRKAHRENLLAHGCHVREEGEGAHIARMRAAADAELDAVAEAAAVDFVNTAPKEKVETLAAELSYGGDASFIRTTA